MMEHDETKLPKWAQKRLNDLRFQVQRLQALSEAHCVLENRRWFTIKADPVADAEFTKLFTLYENGAHPVCSIGRDDVLLIGRGKELGA